MTNIIFNEEQENIINYFDSCFVEAMAGSGKTTLLVEKINNLCNKNKNWKKIAYITFARKAALEGKLKLKDLSFRNFIGTYDHFLMQEIIVFAKHTIKKEIIYDWNKRILKDFNSGMKIFIETGKIYSYTNDQTKEGKNFLSDLALLILEQNINARNYLSSKYIHIYNDEAQDYNSSQICLINYIFTDLKIPMTFVGDFNQAIYAFRGSKPDEVKKFLKEKKIKNFQLSKNYRCEPSIQDYALHFLGYTEIKFPIKESFFYIQINNLMKIQDEIEKIVKKIIEKHKSLVILRYSIKSMNDILTDFVRIKPLVYENDLDFPEWCAELIKNILTKNANEYNFLYYIQDLFEINIKKTIKNQLETIKKNFKINKEKTIKALNYLFLELTKEENQELSEKIWFFLNNDEVEKNINQQRYLNQIGTVHSAKGLEYDNVLIFTSDFNNELFDDNSNIIKYYNQTKSIHYVACTRARKNLFIIHDVEYNNKYFQNYKNWKNHL